MKRIVMLAAILLTGCLSLGVAGAAERGEGGARGRGGKKRAQQEVPAEPGTLRGRLYVERDLPCLVSGGRSYPLRLSAKAPEAAKSVLAEIPSLIRAHKRSERRGLDWAVVRGRIEKDETGAEYVLADAIEVLPPVETSKGKGKKGGDAPEE